MAAAQAGASKALNSKLCTLKPDDAEDFGDDVGAFIIGIGFLLKGVYKRYYTGYYKGTIIMVSLPGYGFSGTLHP